MRRSFAHNPASQIVSATSSNDSYAWSGHFDENTATTTNGLNELLTVGGASFAYDANGNLASDGTDTFGYDIENELTSATEPGKSVTLSYDPLGRLSKIAGSGIADLSFVEDPGSLDAIAADYVVSTGNLYHRYVFGPGADEPIVDYDSTGARTWLIADERGSIIARPDASGNASSSRINSYDEYGVPGANNSGRFGYTGQAALHEIGLDYYKARMYAPDKGGFLQTDPTGYGDGPNWYEYAHGDAVNFVDPTGLCSSGEVRVGGGVTVDPKTGGPIINGGTCVPDSFFKSRDEVNSHPGPAPGGTGGAIVITARRLKHQQQQCDQPPFSTALANPAVQDQIDKAIAKSLSTPNLGVEEPNQPGVFDVPSHGSEFGFNVLIGSLVTHVGGLQTSHLEFSVERTPPILPLLATVLFIHVHQSPSGEPGLSPADQRLGVDVIAVTPQHATFCASAS